MYTLTRCASSGTDIPFLEKYDFSTEEAPKVSEAWKAVEEFSNKLRALRANQSDLQIEPSLQKSLSDVNKTAHAVAFQAVYERLLAKCIVERPELPRLPKWLAVGDVSSWFQQHHKRVIRKHIEDLDTKYKPSKTVLARRSQSEPIHTLLYTKAPTITYTYDALSDDIFVGSVRVERNVISEHTRAWREFAALQELTLCPSVPYSLRLVQRADADYFIYEHVDVRPLTEFFEEQAGGLGLFEQSKATRALIREISVAFGCLETMCTYSFLQPIVLDNLFCDNSSTPFNVLLHLGRLPWGSTADSAVSRRHRIGVLALSFVNIVLELLREPVEMTLQKPSTDVAYERHAPIGNLLLVAAVPQSSTVTIVCESGDGSRISNHVAESQLQITSPLPCSLLVTCDPADDEGNALVYRCVFHDARTPDFWNIIAEMYICAYFDVFQEYKLHWSHSLRELAEHAQSYFVQNSHEVPVLPISQLSQHAYFEEFS